MNKSKAIIASATVALSAMTMIMPAYATGESAMSVSDDAIEANRATLAASTSGAGFGPQSPRNIDVFKGSNDRDFEAAPSYTDMNLCNIHFHDGAEHKGGDFTTYRGNGDGKGFGTGYLYSGKLSESELTDPGMSVGKSDHGELTSGDTIELHYVHSTAKVKPGPTLGACLSESIINPQLRVETQVYVLVNDNDALDFMELTKIGLVDGKYQALNIPANTGVPVEYAGSTTGPGFNEKGSPLQVSWSVRPEVLKVDIKTVAEWFESNVFEEKHAHGVRNLIINPLLLSEVEN